MSTGTTDAVSSDASWPGSDVPKTGLNGAQTAGADSTIDDVAAAAAMFASAFDRWANRKAVEAGISAQRLRLLNVVHCHGPQKMADLADALAVTPRNVTALVDGLEADGLIRRVPHATDRRVTMVQLSCSSVSVESQYRAFQDSVGTPFSKLSVDDRRTLQRILTALRDQMNSDASRSVDAGVGADA